MKQIFINLPVKNVDKSLEFYTQLGFTNKALFSDEQQKCMVWSESVYVMLLSEEKFTSYSQKVISNNNMLNAYFTLNVDSLSEVQQIINKGLKYGGKTRNTLIDEGFMQIRRIEDLDGHIWDIVYMDLAQFEKK